jgi:hypothetical protein
MRCFLISSLVIAICSRSAYADRKINPAATVELERGEAKFRDKDYAGAIAAFEAGYAIDPQPIFLYDKAQALRLSGDCHAAIEVYKAFIASQPAPDEATRAKKNIENCEATLPPPPPPRAAPPRPAPAPAVDTEAAPLPAGPPKREPELAIAERSGWWSDGLGITLVTTGVIGVGVGCGFAIAARSAAVETALATNVNEWASANHNWERDRLIAGVALGTGAAVLAAGVLRLSFRDRGVGVSPATGNGAVVSIGGGW